MNLREVTKKGYKRNLLDFEQGKGFLLRPHKSYKHKLDNNTSSIISRNTGNVTCVTEYMKYRKSAIEPDTIYAFHYVFLKDNTKRTKDNPRS